MACLHLRAYRDVFGVQASHPDNGINIKDSCSLNRATGRLTSYGPMFELQLFVVEKPLQGSSGSKSLSLIGVLAKGALVQIICKQYALNIELSGFWALRPAQELSFQPHFMTGTTKKLDSRIMKLTACLDERGSEHSFEDLRRAPPCCHSALHFLFDATIFWRCVRAFISITYLSSAYASSS